MHDPGPRQDGRPPSAFSVAADEVTCQQFVELITDYFEGTLAGRSLSHVEEHLVMCDWCVTYLEQTQAAIALLADLRVPPPEPPASALSALRARRRGTE